MKHGGDSVMVWTYMMYKSDIESDRQKKTTKCKPHDEEMNILPAVQINNKCGQIDLTTDMHYHIHFYKVFETSSDEHILNI